MGNCLASCYFHYSLAFRLLSMIPNSPGLLAYLQMISKLKTKDKKFNSVIQSKEINLQFPPTLKIPQIWKWHSGRSIWLWVIKKWGINFNNYVIFQFCEFDLYWIMVYCKTIPLRWYCVLKHAYTWESAKCIKLCFFSKTSKNQHNPANNCRLSLGIWLPSRYLRPMVIRPSVGNLLQISTINLTAGRGWQWNQSLAF